MSVFHFKRFDVINERSSMKVNTDGVLLGAAVSLSATDRAVLDAGTGTGTIALMLAQRYSEMDNAPADISITGIDIDADSASEAMANFALSPWKESLTSVNCPLKDYVPEQMPDLIVSNPPFFDDSLLPPAQRRSMARHTTGPALSFYSLADYSSAHLSPEGRLAVILPSDQEVRTVRYAVSCGLYPFHILRIRTTPRKAVMRVVMEFGRKRPDSIREELLTVQDPLTYPENRNGYTPEYLALTGNFYLK